MMRETNSNSAGVAGSDGSARLLAVCIWAVTAGRCKDLVNHFHRFSESSRLLRSSESVRSESRCQ